ncbi:MAG: class I SAM-dependent methyltransferase [Thermomicrobiales bacterium]
MRLLAALRARAELAVVSNGGERVTHLYPNDGYYMHLSIYRFAAPLARGRHVLDAGSGAGYGACYLADHGAAFVHGVEVDPEAVAFSQYHFRRANLRFRRMDLQQLTGFPAQSVEVIFSSNVLEHVPDVVAFVRAAWRVLTADGVLIVAVPPIVDAATRADTATNPYHLTLWSMRQWQYVLTRFFQEVEYYQHHCTSPKAQLDVNKPASATTVRETDFTFTPLALDESLSRGTITGIFVARQPRPVNCLPAPEIPLPIVDDSYTRPSPLRKPRPLASGIMQRLRSTRTHLVPAGSIRELLWFVLFRFAQIWEQGGAAAVVRKAQARLLRRPR